MRIPPVRVRRKAVWGSRRAVSLLLLGLAAAITTNAAAATKAAALNAGRPSAHVKQYKLDDELTRRATTANPASTTRVIVTLVPGAQLPPEFKKFARGGKLDIINGQVLDLPNGVLKQVASHPSVFRVHYDRPIRAHNYRTGVTVGARQVLTNYGYTGAGIGVAVIDSGITSWHDDLINFTSKTFPYGNQRVAKFVDFVNGRTLPYDDDGHGTHVAGTIAGVGYDSSFERMGMAPQASLVSLKVLDANGAGTISNIIAALNWIVANGAAYNVRVVNMSVGAGVYESYWTDPLTLAAKAVTDSGITIVAAAGNRGKDASGALQWGGITAPANAPWVLTVGASSTMGTLTRADDQMADYSSSGPTFIDWAAKPDVVAPGTGTVSLAAAGSTLYLSKPQYLVKGTNGLFTYMSLSGTSMAAPVVSGTVALMLQANPSLTPNLVKAILQYTAQPYPGYSSLRQGAGFLNTLGAVQLARYLKSATAGSTFAVPSTWGKTILWGNERLRHGFIKPTASAWKNGVVWGAAQTQDVTGTFNVTWGTLCSDATCDNIVWDTTDADNVTWGTACADSICDNIVWGTTDAFNIVWGTECSGANCDNVTWGTACVQSICDNIVWGTANPGDHVMWSSACTESTCSNVTWGTECTDAGCDNVTWGTTDLFNIIWGTSTADATQWVDDSSGSGPLPTVELEFGTVVIPEVQPSSVQDLLMAPSVDPIQGGL